ncbi:hypothetical protein AA313_de0202958 [Arthrobotrys entomopaga]|nr:hypothetical protein AA313_de0202958 [Arthrobotrys entomopaga]
MTGKAQYRRDSSDNVHIIYPAGFNEKAFDSYVPPRYTEATRVAVPIPPPAPLPEKRILGMKRKKFWIILAVFILIVLAVAIGAGVGVAAATKKKHNNNDNEQTADSEGAAITGSPSESPVTVTVTNIPSTMVTSTIPSATAIPVTHCQQMWEGTAPFCDGKCDPGWTVVKQSKVAYACDETTETIIIDSE